MAVNIIKPKDKILVLRRGIKPAVWNLTAHIKFL
jgi:hypothetical protein